MQIYGLAIAKKFGDVDLLMVFHLLFFYTVFISKRFFDEMFSKRFLFKQKDNSNIKQKNQRVH